MRVLLDTHILLWALADSPRLSPRARAVLADPNNECWASSASAWELAIKVSAGRHRLKFALDELGSAISAAGIQSLDVTWQHALAVQRVESPHADPFDRLLLAQCATETLVLLSADRQLAGLPEVLEA